MVNRNRFGPALIALCWIYEARYVFLTWLASVFVAVVTTWWLGLSFQRRCVVVASAAFAFGLFMFVGFLSCLADPPPPKPKPMKIDHARIRREVLEEEQREVQRQADRGTAGGDCPALP